MDQNAQAPLNQPNQFAAPEPQKKKTKTITLVIIAILLMVGFAAGGWYYGTNQAQKESDAKVAELNAKIQDLEDQSSKQDTNPSSSTDSANNDGYLVISQWGVKIKLSDAKYLDYTIKKVSANDSMDGVAGESLNLSFNSSFPANQAAVGCDSPGVNIVRFEKSAKTSGYIRTTKSIGQYKYAITGAPGRCDIEQGDEIKSRILSELKLENIEQA